MGAEHRLDQRLNLIWVSKIRAQRYDASGWWKGSSERIDSLDRCVSVREDDGIRASESPHELDSDV
jgi:hypothetical protein